jgi:hypothetical protein
VILVIKNFKTFLVPACPGLGTIAEGGAMHEAFSDYFPASPLYSLAYNQESTHDYDTGSRT